MPTSLTGKDSAEFLATSGKAANVDKLDNLDPAAFQRSGCVNGNVLGYAFIDDDATGAALGNVPTSFTCVSDFTVQAREDSPTEFTIDFGFNSGILFSPCSSHIPLATIEDLGDIFASSGSESTGPLSQDCVVNVNTFDDLGAAAGVNFSLVIHRVA